MSIPSRAHTPTRVEEQTPPGIYRLSAVTSVPLDAEVEVSPRTAKAKTKNDLDPNYSSPPLHRSPKRNPVEDAEGRPSRRSTTSLPTDAAASAERESEVPSCVHSVPVSEPLDQHESGTVHVDDFVTSDCGNQVAARSREFDYSSNGVGDGCDDQVVARGQTDPVVYAYGTDMYDGCGDQVTARSHDSRSEGCDGQAVARSPVGAYVGSFSRIGSPYSDHGGFPDSDVLPQPIDLEAGVGFDGTNAYISHSDISEEDFLNGHHEQSLSGSERQGSDDQVIARSPGVVNSPSISEALVRSPFSDRSWADEASNPGSGVSGSSSDRRGRGRWTKNRESSLPDLPEFPNDDQEWVGQRLSQRTSRSTSPVCKVPTRDDVSDVQKYPQQFEISTPKVERSPSGSYRSVQSSVGSRSQNADLPMFVNSHRARSPVSRPRPTNRADYSPEECQTEKKEHSRYSEGFRRPVPWIYSESTTDTEYSFGDVFATRPCAKSSSSDVSSDQFVKSAVSSSETGNSGMTQNRDDVWVSALVEELRSTNAKFSAELNDCRIENSALRDKLSESHTEAVVATGKLSEARRRISSLSDELKVQCDLVTELRNELSDLHVSQSELKNQLESVQNESDNVKSRLEESDIMAAETSEKLEISEEKVRSYEAEIIEIQTQLDDALARRVSADARASFLSRELMTTSDVLSRKQEANDRLQKRVHTLMTAGTENHPEFSKHFSSPLNSDDERDVIDKPGGQRVAGSATMTVTGPAAASSGYSPIKGQEDSPEKGKEDIHSPHPPKPPGFPNGDDEDPENWGNSGKFPDDNPGPGGPPWGDPNNPNPPNDRVPGNEDQWGNLRWTHKEADKIELPRLPTVKQYISWLSSVCAEVSSASSYGFQTYFWVRQATQSGQSLGSLAISGEPFISLDAKLAAAIRRILASEKDGSHDRVIAVVNRYTQTYDRDSVPLMGRQLLLLIHQTYRTSMRDCLYSQQDLLSIPWRGDDGIERFLKDWTMVWSQMNDEDCTPSFMESTFFEKIKQSDSLLKTFIDEYERIPIGSPDKNYEYLYGQVEGYVQRRILKNNRDALLKGLSVPPKAVPGVKGKADPKGKGKADPPPKKDPNAKQPGDPNAKADPKDPGGGTKGDKGKGKGKGKKGEWWNNLNPPPPNPNGKGSEKGYRKPCWHYSLGTCQKGAYCSFEHRILTADEIQFRDKTIAERQQGNGGKGAQMPKANQNPFGQQPKACSAYQAGKCRFGANCRDLHGQLVQQFEPTQGMLNSQAIQGGAPYAPFTISQPKPPPQQQPKQQPVNNPFAMGQGPNASNTTQQ